MLFLFFNVLYVECGVVYLLGSSVGVLIFVSFVEEVFNVYECLGWDIE